MVVIKIIYRIFFCLLFLCVSCKKENDKAINKQERQDSATNLKKRIADSILLTKKNIEQYPKTIAKNKEFLESIIFDNTNYDKENDFNNIKKVFLETPIEIDFTYLHGKTNKKEMIFQNFDLTNFLEYKEPYKEYSPFINHKTKQIDFLITYDETNKIPLKISFKKGQYFWFGKNFIWITPKIEINNRSLTDNQDLNINSFCNKDNQKMIRNGKIFEYNKKKYLLFTIYSGIWYIHHLFDVSDDRKIKYYILNSIYTNEEGYGDFSHDNKLDFKQRYFYLRNSEDTTQNKYKIYTIK